MTVTASRLGSSPLTLDWSGLSSISPNPSSTMRNFGPDPQAFNDAWSKLKQRFAAGEVGFYESPTSNDIAQAEESVTLAASIVKSGMFTDCLFLGIGGSSLGPISLLAALAEKRKNRLRFHFMENPDPIDWKSTLQSLNPDTTLICAVTKSGVTFETLAQLMCALEWTGKSRWRSHVVAITDPVKGDLKAFATTEGIPTLHIAPSMGGRFSIFTPVGLFTAALAGLNVTDILLGARQVREYVDKAPLEKNALFILGHELIRHAPRRPITVCMPYSTRLKSLSSWFVQLWGESLGKDGKGFTPIAAIGATDQHSILQLLRDGPDDKVTLFMTVDSVEDEVRIPRAPSRDGTTTGYPAFKILEGHTLHELLMVEYRATALVLAKQNRPSVTLRLDRLDERSMGALFFAFSVLTAFTGALWEVNPFDQPGVEEAKVYIREALGKGGSSQRSATSYLLAEDDDNSPADRLRRHRAHQD